MAETAARDDLTRDSIAQDVARWQRVLADTYNNTDLASVIVVDGYGLSVSVKHGQLVIRDGIGRHARTRIISRSDRTVRRIVVLGHAGTITLDALRWCNDIGVTLAIIDKDGTLAAATASPNPTDARLRRAQALADGTPLGDQIASFLIAEKIKGQRDLLAHWGIESSEIDAHLTRLASGEATSADAAECEARAARIYFAHWSQRVTPTYPPSQAQRIPQAWRAPFTRRSRVSRNGPRAASDPVNAMLNYTYSLGESIVRQHCNVVGLDPALGVLHRDKRYRDSMVFDLLEPLRPIIDRDVVRFIGTRTFHRTDFIETRDGTCRLSETVAHPLAGYMPSWAVQIGGVVETVSHMLAEAATGKVGTRTPLTNRQGTHPVRTPATCRDCGTTIAARRDKRCEACKTRRKRQPAPTHDTPRSNARRQTNREIAEWEAQHGADFTMTLNDYLERIRPGLANVRAKEIVAVTGMSRGYASRVQTGLDVPHRRHWEALAKLTQT